MFQYNLRSLMYLMVAAALLCWVLFAIPGVVGVLILAAFYVILPGMAITGVVFLRNRPRAFCIATLPALALVPFFLLILFNGPYFYRSLGEDESLIVKAAMLGGFVVIVAAGAGGMFVHHLARANQPTRAPSASLSPVVEAYHREDPDGLK